tara:strand:- start:62 stop:808 length:747 start_codon:yes stop_codon:yes gene_type:complete
MEKSAWKALLNPSKYNEVASKGRFGDSELRMIQGTPQHVNKFEADIIDEFGKQGEDFVDSIGSGTTNPETGLEENFLFGLGTLVSSLIVAGTAGVGNYLYNEYQKGQEAEEEAENIVESGLQDLGKQSQEYLGGSGGKGLIAKSADLKRTGQALDMTSKLNALDNVEAKSDLVGSGSIDMNKSMMNRQYGTTMTELSLGEERERKDYIADLKRQSRQLQLDYLSATGESYDGGEGLDYLDDLFSSYEL